MSLQHAIEAAQSTVIVQLIEVLKPFPYRRIEVQRVRVLWLRYCRNSYTTGNHYRCNVQPSAYPPCCLSKTHPQILPPTEPELTIGTPLHPKTHYTNDSP